jgi:FMN phosphatase YigB (HAD superfamily)
MPELPIKLVTFDLYDTLIELHPTRWDRLGEILQSLEIASDIAALRQADVAAEDFYTEMNTIQPIRDRPAVEREAFRREHLRRWLRAAGVSVGETAMASPTLNTC